MSHHSNKQPWLSRRSYSYHNPDFLINSIQSGLRQNVIRAGAFQPKPQSNPPKPDISMVFANNDADSIYTHSPSSHSQECFINSHAPSSHSQECIINAHSPSQSSQQVRISNTKVKSGKAEIDDDEESESVNVNDNNQFNSFNIESSVDIVSIDSNDTDALCTFWPSINLAPSDDCDIIPLDLDSDATIEMFELFEYTSWN